MFKIKFYTNIFIIFIILASYYFRFAYKWQQIEREYYTIIKQSYMNPFNLVVKDFSKILNLFTLVEEKKTDYDFNNRVLQLNLIKNFSIKPSLNTLQNKSLESTNYDDILEIKRLNATASIDLYSLKTFIKSILPEYIDYSVYLNNKLIINSGNSVSYLEVTQKNNLPLSNMLVIKISIKENFLQQEKKNLLFYVAVDHIAIMIPFTILALLFHRRINYYLKKELKFLQQNFLQLNENKKNLENKIKLSREYSLMMTQRINGQAKNKLIIKLTGEEVYDKVPKSLAVFPIAIIDHVKSIINIKELLKDLELFFQYELCIKGVKLSIFNRIDTIEINASREALYQIIFSLVFNVLNLIPDHTNLGISIIDKDRFTFLLKYTGFNLSEEQMRNYTSRYSTEVFLLNLNQVFDHLKLYKFSYFIEKNAGNNVIKIQSSNDTHNKKFKSNILVFKDFIKK